MKTIISIFVLLFVFAGCAWTPADRSIMVAYTALNVVDIMQTREIFNNPDYYELNPLLTEDNHVALLIVGNVLLYVIADILPNKYRTAFLGLLTAGKFMVVGNNYRIGIRF